MDSTIIKFLEELQENNNRQWFAMNKTWYEEVKSALESFLDEVLIPGISRFDSRIGRLTAKQCMFRIYRDIRFSKDKSPYKTYFGSYIAPGGRKSPFTGYYLHLEPDNCFAAGGVHAPKGETLKNIRFEIYNRYDEFLSLLNDKRFKKYFGGLEGEKLKRPPAGFPKNFPGSEYLKYKEFIYFRRFDAQAMDDPGFSAFLLETFQAMKPVNDFFNGAML